ncbi:hypothetical protein [Caballeronia telluris]|uniref:hypothetical protein n=1 Tax=Caballeronia telluris TaxID=326475 RepID=UPI00190EC444|nr:hypothetical protein [Caballeronia telluris]
MFQNFQSTLSSTEQRNTIRGAIRARFEVSPIIAVCVRAGKVRLVTTHERFGQSNPSACAGSGAAAVTATIHFRYRVIIKSNCPAIATSL